MGKTRGFWKAGLNEKGESNPVSPINNETWKDGVHVAEESDKTKAQQSEKEEEGEVNVEVEKPTKEPGGSGEGEAQKTEGIAEEVEEAIKAKAARIPRTPAQKDKEEREAQQRATVPPWRPTSTSSVQHSHADSQRKRSRAITPSLAA